MPHNLRPLKPGEPPSADRFNEVIDRLNVVSGITGVYPIEVQRQAGGLQIALARQFKAWLFQIQDFEEPVPTTTDGVPYFPATRVRLDGSDEYAAHEPVDVPLFDPLAKDQPERKLHAGDWALATFNADSGRWEIIRDPTGRSAVVRFRTTATLAPTGGHGGAAAAVTRVWDGAAYQDGDSIIVEDFTIPGRWSAVNGAEGVAVKLADKDEYVILWIEHQAIFATATLSGNMTAGTAACAFTDSWQGPAGVGAAAQVYDVDGRYSGLLTGDKVLACWDDVESKYKICDGPQTSKLKWAYATADWINGPLNTSKVVCEAATGKDGASAGGGTFDVWLPRPSGSVDPNVRQGAIIGYTIDEADLRIAVTGYLDDCLGTIKIWSGSVATIPAGWQLCDGASGTPNLREKFVLGATGDSGGDSDFDGEGGNTFIGETGGLKRKLTNWEHTNFGSPLLRTFNTLQEILQTESFHTEKEDPPLDVEVSATGTGTLDGDTDYALADLYVTTEQPTPDHIDHIHLIAVASHDVEDPGNELSLDIPTTSGEAPCNAGPEIDTGPQCARGTVDVEGIEPCVYFTQTHYLTEPGQSAANGFMHPVQTGNDPPNDIPAGKSGHKHGFSGVSIDAADFDFDAHLIWGVGDYDGHDHTVQAGTLDGKLAIRDVTHNSPAGCPINEHYHDFEIDNHQEYINRVPPYFSLAYIMRVS